MLQSEYDNFTDFERIMYQKAKENYENYEISTYCVGHKAEHESFFKATYESGFREGYVEGHREGQKSVICIINEVFKDHGISPLIEIDNLL